jgi:biotin carboxyl carrier protein
VTTRCTVEENGAKRTFVVTLEPAVGAGAAPAAVAEAAPATTGGTQVFSTFAGSVEIVDILVNVGDSVFKGGVVAEVEAMKAKHDIKAQCDGKVSAIHAKIGDEIDSSKPIMTIL